MDRIKFLSEKNILPILLSCYFFFEATLVVTAALKNSSNFPVDLMREFAIFCF